MKAIMNSSSKFIKAKIGRNLARAARHSAILLAGFLLLLATAGMRATDIPAAINYQGRLTDNLGNPIATGYYEVQFKIWDDPTQSGAGDYIWGRSFAVHVVTNGLFNVLLSDGGGAVGSPQTNNLLYAFNGPNRYLGLTVTMENNTPVNSPVEITPRQQLVSAPFAIQAQTANQVAPNGVSSNSLANASVTTAKLAPGAVNASILAPSAVTSGAIAAGAVTSSALAANSVTSAALAANSVTSAALANGSVTAAKLNVDQDFQLNDHAIYLRQSGDQNHGLRFATNYQNAYVNGPVLFGYSGGLLTATVNSKPALLWDANGNVAVGDIANAGADRLEINGNARMNEHDLFLRSYHDGAADINHGLGYYGSVNGVSKPFSGFSVDGPVLYGFSGGALGIVRDSATNQSIVLSWQSNGRVGVGTTSPQAALHVKGTKVTANGSGGKYFNESTSGIASLGNATQVIGYFEGDLVADGGICSLHVTSWSDARAKNIIGISSGLDDLRKLDQIQITDYRWIDQTQDRRRHKKVIAQQVEQVLPEAVSQMRKLIPNVYAKASGLEYDPARQRLTLTLDKVHDFQVGDKVNVSTDQGDLDQVQVLNIPSPNVFTIACAKQPQGAFVYGKWVDDYRMVDYDAIAMLNVSATQELHRQLKEKDAEIRRLQAQLDALITREEEMALRFAKLESLVQTAKTPFQKASLR
jgi:hypothetical protein